MSSRCGLWIFLFLTFTLFQGAPLGAERFDLPARNGSLQIDTQADPEHPGHRTVECFVHYPGGLLENVGQETGIMLSLHNWGGTGCGGAPDASELADRYDVIGICVDYLDSGKWDPEVAGTYDFGCLQAIDSLRSLQAVLSGLKQAGLSFDTRRLYACGGSGGGNVALMCNKFAPRTFACVIDLSGMTLLSDDIAFNLPGGSKLNAGYSREETSPHYLAPASQEIRFLGHPQHLRKMVDLGNTAHIVVSHGASDEVCPATDARAMAAAMKEVGLSVESHFISLQDLDGKVFQNTEHSIGPRNLILQHFADRYLRPDSPSLRIRTGANDFDRGDDAVRYPVQGGEFVVSYREGPPTLRFEPE